jgi:hypothetical protein
VGDDVSHVDGIEDFDIRALYAEHTDCFICPVGHKGEVTGWTEAQARRLLADRHSASKLGRVGFEVDDIDFVVGRDFKIVTVFDDIDGIGHERHRVGRIDRHVDRRADHRVLEWKIGDGLWVFRIGEIEDDDRIFPGRGQDRLGVGVKRQLLIVADDHEWCGVDECQVDSGEDAGRYKYGQQKGLPVRHCCFLPFGSTFIVLM